MNLYDGEALLVGCFVIHRSMAAFVPLKPGSALSSCRPEFNITRVVTSTIRGGL